MFFFLQDTQYFLAGSLRTAGDEDLIQDGKWFGCSTVPTPGGLCEVQPPIVVLAGYC